MKTTETKPTVSAFTIGEVLPQSDSIQIKITAVYPESNTLEAEVIKADGYFSKTFNHTFRHQDGYTVGMELRFEPLKDRDGVWKPKEKYARLIHIPEFILIVTDKGEKMFTTY